MANQTGSVYFFSFFDGGTAISTTLLSSSIDKTIDSPLVNFGGFVLRQRSNFVGLFLSILGANRDLIVASSGVTMVPITRR